MADQADWNSWAFGKNCVERRYSDILGYHLAFDASDILCMVLLLQMEQTARAKEKSQARPGSSKAGGVRFTFLTRTWKAACMPGLWAIESSIYTNALMRIRCGTSFGNILLQLQHYFYLLNTCRVERKIEMFLPSVAKHPGTPRGLSAPVRPCSSPSVRASNKHCNAPGMWSAVDRRASTWNGSRLLRWYWGWGQARRGIQSFTPN
jgi:hypothetical protein